MRDIYIFGHKKPDTDTVTSAIALSYLKNQLGLNTKPMVLGEINNETKFALDYFNIEKPSYLEDVKLQIKDLNYYKDCFINSKDSINHTYDYILNRNITGVPIVDYDNHFLGLLTSKMIGHELINGDFTKLNTSYNNIKDVLKAEEVLKFDDEISGNIIVASYRSTTFLNTLTLTNSTIMIVGDRHSLIEAAVNSGIKLLVIVGNSEIKEEHIRIAINNRVNIIRTGYDTFHTAKLIGLSNYAGNLITDSRNVKFNENDYYDEFKEKALKLGFNNYPVIDNDNKCLGLIRITDINEMNRKQVILVDHNEISQSVDGLNEAEILEIIDHHKLGAITTSMPINFRNMTVGSTNTIIYSMYGENHVSVPPDIAGIMLSGILSDTLKFTSPTTTSYDKYVAKRLSKIANVDIDTYAKEMFKSGTNLSGKTLTQIIDGDIKIFDINGKRVAVSQVITLNSEEILEKREDYISELNKIKKDREYDLLLLCVTDILKDGSYLFFDELSKDLISLAFNKDNIVEGYFLSKCLSRKKQLIPPLMNVIK